MGVIQRERLWLKKSEDQSAALPSKANAVATVVPLVQLFDEMTYAQKLRLLREAVRIVRRPRIAA